MQKFASATGTFLFAIFAFTPDIGVSAELVTRPFCIFDMIGKSGPVYGAMQDYRLAAINWGADLEMKSFIDEKVVAEEFKTDKCDIVAISGVRGRIFNSFTGTLDSLGAIPSYKVLRVVLEKLTSPQLAPLMKNGDYEVAGISPAGAAYMFVNDRSIDTVSALSGKRIGVLDFDKSQTVMVESVGASPVTVTFANVAGMFNNNAVDVIAAPAVAYQPLELHKGLGSKGGVINYSIVQSTLQIFIKSSRFPPGFGQKSREYMYSQYDKNMREIDNYTNSIEQERWVEISDADKTSYQEMFRTTRLKLRDMKIYNGKMLTFLSRVRCSMESALPECTSQDRE
ncbi:RND type efflux pump involved in aminoglycoside resistance [gamma proteobacterium HdN1]|nr:RND type efflux pump involved in aminoglycoside resistance [gamma proteobacterium HdN1]